MKLADKTISAFRVVRLERFDTSTPEGRSKERYRRVGLTALASIAAKGLNVVTLLVTVPLTLHYLGVERFGLWMTISSLIGMFCFADLGMNAALKTLVAEADGQSDQEKACRLISSAYVVLSAVALLLLLAMGLVYPFLNWMRLYNIQDSQVIVEAGPATAVVGACFLLNIPLGLINQIQSGYQNGFANAIWQSFGSLVTLTGVAVAVWTKAGLVWLALAMSGGTLLASLLNSLFFFGFRNVELFPRFTKASWELGKLVVRTGLLYLALAVAVSLIFYSDNLVAAHLLGPEAVTQYSVAVRLFSLVSLVCGFFMTPFWPAYSEALARGDFAWVRKTLARTLWISIGISALLSTILVVGQESFIEWWLGGKVQLPFELTLGMGLWTVVTSAAGAVAMFLNGAKVVIYQVVTSIFLAGGTLAGKIVLTDRYGISGLVGGNLLGYLFFWFLPLIFFLPWFLKRFREPQPEPTAQ
jgi:O-antigen/teichoic acid export membrane protein